MIKADLYLRLSDARTENGSFVDREKALRERATQLKWTIGRVVIENDCTPDGTRSMSASAFKQRKVLLPDGTTGLRVVRPGFRSILDDLTSGRANAILVEDSDRALRDHRDAQDLIDAIRLVRGNAQSLSGSLTLTNGGTDSEIMMTEINTTVSKKEAADKRRRSMDGRERSAKSGKFAGGRRMFGWCLGPPKMADEDAGRVAPVCPWHGGRDCKAGITPIKAETDVIADAGKRLLTKVKLSEITRDLRNGDVPTVTGVPWSSEILRDIMLRPRNAGIKVLRGEEIGKAPWQPIIPENEWRSIVTLLSDPKRRTGPGPVPKHLLSGLVLCHCGSLMEYGATRSIYRCKIAAKGCSTIPAAALDAFVIGLVCSRMERDDAADLIATAPDVDMGALRQQAAALRIELEGLAAVHGRGEITMPEWLAARSGVSARLAAAEAEMESATTASPLDGLVGAEDVQAAWEGLGLAGQRAAIRALFVITVKPGRGWDVGRIDVRPAEDHS
jgi:hypothetical protein